MFTSRFFTEDDPRQDEVVLPLPHYWWSRPYEYAWASQFAQGTVLDAACGICHPFKFYLTDLSADVHACDWDQRIQSKEAIIQDVLTEFGQEGVSVIQEQSYLDRLQLHKADLTDLPYSNDKFDTIFCISVFEHVPDAQKVPVLKEFQRVLKPEGRLVLTLDYPLADPAFMLVITQACGLRLLGPSHFEVPGNAIQGQGLKCYRMILGK